MHRYEKHRETQLKVATRKWSQFRVAQEHASAVQMHIRQWKVVYQDSYTSGSLNFTSILLYISQICFVFIYPGLRFRQAVRRSKHRLPRLVCVDFNPDVDITSTPNLRRREHTQLNIIHRRDMYGFQHRCPWFYFLCSMEIDCQFSRLNVAYLLIASAHSRYLSHFERAITFIVSGLLAHKCTNRPRFGILNKLFERNDEFVYIYTTYYYPLPRMFPIESHWILV